MQAGACTGCTSSLFDRFKLAMRTPGYWSSALGKSAHNRRDKVKRIDQRENRQQPDGKNRELGTALLSATQLAKIPLKALSHTPNPEATTKEESNLGELTEAEHLGSRV